MEKTMSLESVDSHPHPNLIGQMNFVLLWILENNNTINGIFSICCFSAKHAALT
jgi:hypothetical protein